MILVRYNKSTEEVKYVRRFEAVVAPGNKAYISSSHFYHIFRFGNTIQVTRTTLASLSAFTALSFIASGGTPQNSA